jgi:hypothetical protein
MNLIRILRNAAVAAMAIVAIHCDETPAQAAIIHITFSGVMKPGGIDYHDMFGLAASGGFGGQTITGNLYFDPAKAPAPDVRSEVNTYEDNSGTPWLWGSFTLNGVTREIGPDFLTYTLVSSADYGSAGDILSFSVNASLVQTSATEELTRRTGLDLYLFDYPGIIYPGKDLPTTAFDWVAPADGVSELYTVGQIHILDNLEYFPNGPIETLAWVEGEFGITRVSASVLAVDSPANLPTFAAGLGVLALMIGPQLPRVRSRRA